ncbi:MAG: response regulator [Halobacteriota archaeon]|nr:response regulator [Halobacteriota archaeon]
MSNNAIRRPIDVLLVEDNPGDIRLTEEAFKEGMMHINLHVVTDGIEATKFLKKEGEYADAPSPDLVLLDLNMPRKNGCEVLEDIKADEDLRRIPIVILTTSRAEEDIIKSYNLHANCFITKPVDMDQFVEVIKFIEGFWFSVVRLPGGT